MIKYNLDKLIRVRLLNYRVSDDYYYRKEKRRWWGYVEKEGVYCGWTGEYVGLEPPINHTMTSSTIYENPRVILDYQSDIRKVYYFERFEDAVKFANELTEGKNWIV